VQQWLCKDTGVAEIDRVTKNIYLGDPGVDSVYCILYLISYNYIIQQITQSIFPNFVISLAYSETLCGSMHLCESSKQGNIIPPHPHPRLREPDLCIIRKSILNAARGATECQRWALTLLASQFHHKWSPNSDSGSESSVQNGGKNP